MHEKDMETRAIRTVRRKQIQDLLAVLSFMLLLPYTCSALSGARGEAAVETIGGAVEGDNFILWEKENGVWKLSMDDFLEGALAASMPAAYREETLKAQAVILRSICMREMEEGGALKKEDSRLEYLDEEDRKKLWGEDFEENEARFLKAVQDTSGIVITYGGELVKPPYFRLSAGRTRSGAEIFGMLEADSGGQSKADAYPAEQDRAAVSNAWCRSTECPHDLEADEFLQEKKVTRGEFSKKLASEGMVLPKEGAKLTLVRDSAGYVLFVRCMDSELEGEKFRKLFDLPSSCFYLKEESGNIILQTKGVGHGLGFDQYSAELLAEEGKDYTELLNFFFSGISLEKR